MRLVSLVSSLALTGLVACGKKAPDHPTAQLPAPTGAPPAPAPTTAPTAPAPTATMAAPDAGAAPAPTHAAPVAKKVPVSDTFHGVEVGEDYRWLEDPKDAEVTAWVAAQNTHTRAALDALPGRDVIGARVKATFGAELVSYGGVQVAGGSTFAFKRQPPKQQPFLVVTKDLADLSGAKTLVDPNTLDPDGGLTIDFFVPSPDGKLVAVSASKAGTESGDVTVWEVETGAQLDTIPRVNGGTAGGSVAWTPEGKGLYYTRYPRGEDRPEADRDFYVEVWFHALGAPAESDRYEMGKDQPRIAEYDLRTDLRTGRVLATVQNGDGGEFAHFLREPAADGTGAWRQLTRFEDKVLVASFGPGDSLFLLSRAGAPKGKIVELAISDADLAKAKEIVPEGQDAIVDSFWGPRSVVPTATRLYVLYQLGGPSEIRAFDLAGKPAAGPKAEPVTANGELAVLGGDDVLFQTRSFVAPTAYYVFAAESGATTKTALVNQAPFTMDDVEVRREMATSKDGTQVPVNILVRKGMAQDGTAAGIVTGYGGYGVNIEPSFSARARLALDQGLVYAIANVRGGGEFGEAWHRGGNLVNKQNVFDDFIAVCEHLVATKTLARDRVGIIGGSNGGLLMGAVMTQRPELFGAVVSLVGIYDMLRVELSPNGAFNVPEFGTVKDEAQFKAMRAYSPLHNVKDGVAYPPTLFITGDNDPRVDPMQSRKMTARLQAAIATSPSPATPLLLRTTSDAGHGGDTKLDEQIAQWTDIYTFFFHALGVEVSAPK